MQDSRQGHFTYKPVEPFPDDDKVSHESGYIHHENHLLYPMKPPVAVDHPGTLDKLHSVQESHIGYKVS